MPGSEALFVPAMPSSSVNRSPVKAPGFGSPYGPEKLIGPYGLFVFACVTPLTVAAPWPPKAAAETYAG